MRRILLFLIALHSLNSYSQAAQELFIKQIITSPFVNDRPLALKLDLSDTTDFINEFVETTGQSLNTEVLTDLIKQSQVQDTKKWSDKELPNSFLINDKRQKPSASYFFKKYKPATKADTLRLKYLIEQYQELLKEGGGYSYSRPIFDVTGQYALVAVDYEYNLSGRGRISIYHFSEGKWNELGPIKSWIH